MGGNGKTKRGAINSSFSQKRKDKQIEWIRTLQTAYPYGINNKAGDETTTNKDKLVGSNFLPLERKYFLIHENKHVNTNAIYGRNFLHKLNAQSI